jgi:hypothetical protein
LWPGSCIQCFREGEVRNGTLINLVLGLNLAIAGAACSSARGNEDGRDATASGSGDEVTIAGCLSGTDGRFALTAAPDAAGAVAGRAVVGDERETHSYMLIGGTNLQEHVGKRVEVRGTIVGGEKELEHEATKKTEQPDATGSGDRPTVKTQEDVEVEVRQLNVREVRAVSGTCQLTQ